MSASQKERLFHSMCLGGLVALIVTAGVAYGLDRLEWQRQSEIAREASACLASNDTPAGLRPYIPVRGKVLIWDLSANDRSAAYDRIPLAMRATSADESMTILLVKSRIEHQSMPAAWLPSLDVRVVYWPSKESAGMAVVNGPTVRLCRT